MTGREGGGGWEFSKPQKNRKQHEINYKYRLFEIKLDRERLSFFSQSQASEIMQTNGKKEERSIGAESLPLVLHPFSRSTVTQKKKVRNCSQSKIT